MAAVPVTLVGILAHGDGTSENVTFTGMGSLTGLSVGGGPAEPPLGIWGPNDPRPTHPIAPGGPVGPPDWGIQYPPGFHPGNPPERPQPQPPLTIWGPNDPRPTHPIVIPPPPPEFPANPPEGVKPPPPDGGWGYHPEYGWGYFPMTGGKPQPGPEKKK